VPIKTEYFKNDLWVLNTDDSNCTNIDFSQDNNDMSLLPIGSQDISASINNITSTGQLLLGVAVSSDDLLMNPPNEVGELILQLNPLATPSGWPSYLNYDWNGDNVIDENDFPSATVTFGQFRGNDKIIQWREVFN
jgi:MSHA biogenesis protein MshQ